MSNVTLYKATISNNEVKSNSYDPHKSFAELSPVCLCWQSTSMKYRQCSSWAVLSVLHGCALCFNSSQISGSRPYRNVWVLRGGEAFSDSSTNAFQGVEMGVQRCITFFFLTLNKDYNLKENIQSIWNGVRITYHYFHILALGVEGHVTRPITGPQKD